MKTNEHPLKDWIPYKLIIDNKTPLVHWLYISDISFSHPFFGETIAQCKSHKYNSSEFKCVSSLESMLEWSYSLSEISPITFIFHVSRCGSTLLSQLIGLNEKYTVLAEVPFFDELLRLPYKLKSIDNKFREKLLEAGIRFVGQNKNGNEEHLFIKTDSWHISFYSIFRQLFPSASIILLYRSPDEVLYSHQKLRGMQAVPRLIEPEVFGFTEKEIIGLSQDEYTAKVLEKYMLLFKEVVTHDKLALLLNYNQGAKSMIHQTGEHLKINWEEKHLLQIQNRKKFHSKHPQQNFREELKKEEIPDYLKDAMNVYDCLDEKRNEL